jgi:hypothetical protein
MNRWLLRMFESAARALRPAPVPISPRERVLSEALAEQYAKQDQQRAEYMESVHELAEAVQMAGSGPWRIGPAALTASESIIRAATEPDGVRVKESVQGAFGDLELALQNQEWRRELNFTYTQFSRWGIQQIILIARLYYVKNPIIRRLINICAFYVFGRGVEVSSPDENANDVLKEFFTRNKQAFGITALIESEKRKWYDGNLFWVFFADKVNKGLVSVRTIDATEIQEVICDPEDSDTPWFYHRLWTQKTFDETTGAIGTETEEAYYPALNYEPTVQQPTINGKPVMWDSPVLHRKCGYVAKWSLGCPDIYPALDWAKAARKYLEACATKAQALSQFAWSITTKGGQQALENMKQQLQTTAGPNQQGWDTNPTAVNASVFASGPGTKLEAINTRGAGDDPEEVRQYKLMCCIVVGVPETFLADVSTGNLATATTLDRPTELCFLEKQEAWREDLQTIAQYVLKVSLGAPAGVLRESFKDCPEETKPIIREARRTRSKDGVRMVEMLRKVTKGTNITWWEADRRIEENEIVISVNFPAIREGDVPQLVDATVKAMTLGNSSGQVVGIDEKAGVRQLYDVLGVENGDALSEEQYPEATYDAERDMEPPPAPAPVTPPMVKAAAEAKRKK